MAAVIGALLAGAPSGAGADGPPDITAILTPNPTVDPGESTTLRVEATGVDMAATVTFSGDGVTGWITSIRGARVRVGVAADATAATGLRALTITNPDGLADTFADAIFVTGDVPPAAGDVAGRVFEDVDGNGVEDGGDSGLVGVGVTVTDASGGVFSDVTDAAGDFLVEGVGVGEATVVVSQPSGFVVTTGNESQAVTIVDGGLVAAEPVGYQASSLPGVYAWDDVHLLLDASTLQLAEGDEVHSWPDQAGGYEFVVPGALGAPTFVADAGFAGQPSVEFDGVDDALQATFGELNTGDIAFQLVLETQTYTHRSAIMTRSSSAPLETKHVLGYDNYDEGGVLNREPAWVTMSGPNGTQAEHYHPISSVTAGHARNSPTDDPTDAANRVVITYVVRDSGQIRFWDRLDDLLDTTMASAGNDLSQGLRLGGREDAEPRSFAHFRLAYLLVVDAVPYTEGDLLAAAADLGARYNVPGFSTS